MSYEEKYIKYKIKYSKLKKKDEKKKVVVDDVVVSLDDVVVSLDYNYDKDNKILFIQNIENITKDYITDIIKKYNINIYNNGISVSIGNSVKHIKNNAFSNMNIINLDFGDTSNIISIGDYAFANNKITDLVLPFNIGDPPKGLSYPYNIFDTVQIITIGNYAFANNPIENFLLSTKKMVFGHNVFLNNNFDKITYKNIFKRCLKNKTLDKDQLKKECKNYECLLEKCIYNQLF